MNIRRAFIIVLLSSFCFCFALAQDRSAGLAFGEHQNVAAGKSAESHDPALSAPVKSQAAVATTGNSEVFQNILIAAGESVSFDSAIDYSSVSTVAVTVQCTLCASATTSLASSGLVIQARWLVPNADSYVATESRSGSSFPYWDVGCAVFNVYGPQFRLTLQNKGSQDIAIPQVTIFRRLAA